MRIYPELKDLPANWYNIIPDLGFPVPLPVSTSGYPVTFNDMAPFSSSAIINQELERKIREISIPDEILRFYSGWRPTSIYRASNLEKILETSARIFFKDEGANSSGGHEMNTALPQAYYASREKGVRCLVTAAGNGEWGAALTIACNYFGLKCRVFMDRFSYEHKTFARYIMELLGAEVVSSPSLNTKIGQKENSENPGSQGSIGLALSEAFEDAASRDDSKFAWGTVMNHVLLHQTVVGLEAKSQLRRIKVNPDIIISAVGGGSSFGGLVFPFFPDRRKSTRLIAVESASAPSLSKGRYAYDFSDAKGLAFMLKMYTLGHGFTAPGIRAGEMRYHGVSPLISALYREKMIESRSYRQHDAFEAAITFARAEGMIPTPESAYAVRAAMDEASVCKDKNSSKDILFVMDASSHLDLAAFKDFMDGSLENLAFPEEALQKSIDQLPEVPADL